LKYNYPSISHFLGIEFTWIQHANNNLSISLTQQFFTEFFLDYLGVCHDGISTFTIPYRSHQDISVTERDHLRLKYQSIVGSLNWLAHTTRPNILIVFFSSTSNVAHYLSTTKNLGIYFTRTKLSTMESFLHFPIPPNLLSMSDANWGVQDASQTKCSQDLPLFASRSMSTFYIDLLGPLHWLSKQQKVTAGSSTEAKIYATN